MNPTVRSHGARRFAPAWFLAGALLPALAAALPSAAAEKECTDCHGGQDKKAQVVAIDRASPHADLECNECHVTVTTPCDKTMRNVKCKTCHDKQAGEHAKSVHGKGGGARKEDAIRCSDCHGGHDIFLKKDPRSRTHRLHSIEMCAGCHADPAQIAKYKLAPAEVIDNYLKSVHGRGVLKSGLLSSAVCTDCHGAHTVVPHGDPESPVNRRNVPQTCGRCHLGVEMQFEQGAHGMLWKKGSEKGPVCTTCHLSHAIDEPLGAAFLLRMAGQCGTCHEKQAPTYKDTFHGRATSLGYVVAAKCSDCHTPHVNLPKSDPKSSVHDSHRLETCRQCHPDAGANYLGYEPHPRTDDAANQPLLYYVTLFMVLLLTGTFGFFGVHTLLWFQRVLVGWRRGEFPPTPSGGPHVVRFPLVHRVVHLVVICSFLGLAATGLPLKFHHAGWAKALSTVLGGVEIARYFHRFCAVATLGYAAFHLGFLVYRYVLRPPRPFLPALRDSLIPSLDDLKDFYANLKWFFYLGPRPKFGRFTYWEKFDYMAIFWGVPVIGLSGLMLWFPGLFTRFLPGSVLNVAMIIHSEEAMLAISFIFAFHFFHSHLRPEVFPLDVTMFTGRLPLERFKEERPREYEKLVAEGRLESALVAAPAPVELFLARLFGSVALAVGVVLVLAVILTFVL